MSDVKTEERQIHPIVQFKRDMEAMVTKDLDILDDKAKSRMKNAAVVAVTKDPELLLADRQSFMMAIRMCASHGVIPDGNEAVLQVYNTKVKLPSGKEDWIKKVTYLPMVRGIINRVQRSGKIRLFYAEVVCDGEDFTLDLSKGDRRPVHTFDPMSRAEEFKGAYSVAVYDDGTVDTEAMPISEIRKVRAVAKTQKVWDTWEGEKCKVAVMKRHSKRLPLSAEDMDFIINRDETDFEQVRDVTPPADRAPLSQRIQAAAARQAVEADPVAAKEPDAPHWTDSVAYDEAFPGSEAWNEGVKAFQSGDPVESCPYGQSMSESTDWVGGWHGAKEALQ